MPKMLTAVATTLALLAAGQTPAQARAKPRCPTRALALKTKQLVIFKARAKGFPGLTEYVACWRSTGVHHDIATGSQNPTELTFKANGPWVVFVRFGGPGSRGRYSWMASSRNAKTGARGPATGGHGGDPSGGDARAPKSAIDGPPGNFVLSSNGIYAWRVNVPATLSQDVHEEIVVAKPGSGLMYPGDGMKALASAPLPDPAAPPFSALSLRSPCLLTWTTAPGINAPSQADICART